MSVSPQPAYVDSHAHLDDSGFEGELDELLERARAAGVRQILTIGCLGSRPGVAGRLFEISERAEGVVVAAGVHPHDARHWSAETEAELREALSDPRVVALGEIGLDFYYTNSPREQQERAFRRQVEIARELDRPIVIHTRDAWRETIELLSEFYSHGERDSGVFHCFGGDRNMARECLGLGFLVGLGGILTFKKSEGLRQLVATLPSDVLLVETDAPYLAPVPHRGQRNEPAWVALVAEELARCRETEPVEIGRVTSANFRRLMRLERAPGQ